ncbi:CocE/NonD family hydrolase [Streptomyces sp. NPDC001889]
MLRATWRGLPARRYDIGWEPGFEVPAADGSPLIADHYFPRGPVGAADGAGGGPEGGPGGAPEGGPGVGPEEGPGAGPGGGAGAGAGGGPGGGPGGGHPTLLVRSPYGRGLPWGPLYGMLFAEQGFHVILQSCRGTGGSGGTFDLWRHEAADGLAAVEWLREQPWFNGVLGTVGASYLGYTQWALALDPPPELRAMVVQAGLHDPRALFHSGGAFHLENALVVGVGMTHQHRGALPFLRAVLRLARRLRGATRALPARDGLAAGLGAEVPWLDEAVTHPDADDPYWSGASVLSAADGPGVPTALVTGWHDALAGQVLDQYARLRGSGRDTALLVGPWTHTSAFGQGWPEVFAESLGWLRAHLCDDPSALRPTGVRVHVGGQDEWRDLGEWPPAGGAVHWYPTPQGYLTRLAPTDSAPLAAFRYDPADPTPSVGGPLLSRTAGSRDNGALEARDDVLTFTGPPLADSVDVLGAVAARLEVSTDTGHADLFARLCEVDGEGRSVNVCDGLVRVRTEGERAVFVTVPMGSTAHRFAAGHRVRLQISGGAHPRCARGTGTGEPSATATVLVPVNITVHMRSALILPAGAPVVPAVPVAPPAAPVTPSAPAGE